MGLYYGTEKVFGVPISDGDLSFGSISASGVTPYVEVNGAVISGSISYDTVTVTLKGISNPPAQKPGVNGFSGSFSAAGRSWTVIDATPGVKFTIGSRTGYFSYSVTGADFSRPMLKV